jgi:hypothetical protein
MFIAKGRWAGITGGVRAGGNRWDRGSIDVQRLGKDIRGFLALLGKESDFDHMKNRFVKLNI